MHPKSSRLTYLHTIPIQIPWCIRTRALMVANDFNGTVSLVNTTSGAYMGSLPTGRGPFDVVYDPIDQFFYVSNNPSGNVSLIQYNYTDRIWITESLNRIFGISPNGFNYPTGI